MKFLFCGLGSIGRRHVENINTLSDKIELIAYRSGSSMDDEFEKKYGIKTFNIYEKALENNPNVVFFTNPTFLHIEMAIKAVKKNCHLFIEKPISNNIDRIDELIELVHEKQSIAMVGCCLRFHKGIRLIKKMVEQNKIGKIISIRAQYGNYLPNWHPWEDYRKMYFAKEKMGGGVVLDLIHEMDYIFWMLGMPQEIFSYSAKLSNLEIETEDFAEILLKYKDGKVANIHLDCIQRAPVRNCKIIGENGTILWDYYENEVKFFTEGMREWSVIRLGKYNHNDMYLEEMEHFLACLEKKEKPLITLNEAKEVLKIALAAKKSSITGKVITLQ